VWSSDGTELFYRNGNKMMVVEVGAEPSAASLPRLLFESGGEFETNRWMPYYDVSPDGERFLMIRRAGATESTGAEQIHVVLNWFEELERLVPTDN